MNAAALHKIFFWSCKSSTRLRDHPSLERKAYKRLTQVFWPNTTRHCCDGPRCRCLIMTSNYNSFLSSWASCQNQVHQLGLQYWRLSFSAIVLISCQLDWWIEVKTYHGVAWRGVATNWWMLPGWCHRAGNGDSWYHMCVFRFHFWIRKVNWNQASHVRAFSVPTLHACCFTKHSCHYLFVARVGCWFCDFSVSFLLLLRSKNRLWKYFSSVLLLRCACGSQKWTARLSHF